MQRGSSPQRACRKSTERAETRRNPQGLKHQRHASFYLGVEAATRSRENPEDCLRSESLLRGNSIYCVGFLRSEAKQSLQMPPTSVRETVTLMSQSREI